MNERLQVRRLKENPRPKRRRKSAVDRRRRASTKKRARRQHRAARAKHAFVVEVLCDRRGNVDFLYWTGKKLERSRAKAKRYPTATLAHHAARLAMRNRPLSYKFARVVPA